jgi:hypothetical protein
MSTASMASRAAFLATVTMWSESIEPQSYREAINRHVYGKERNCKVDTSTLNCWRSYDTEGLCRHRNNEIEDRLLH